MSRYVILLAIAGCWYGSTPQTTAPKPVAASPANQVTVAVASPTPNATPRKALTVARRAETTLTPDLVIARIRSDYMGGVRRCYTSLLKKHGGARGKVMVTFTVDPKGRTTGAARGFANKVDACITAQITNWKFPAPRDDVGAPTEAAFALPIDLRPES